MLRLWWGGDFFWVGFGSRGGARTCMNDSGFLGFVQWDGPFVGSRSDRFGVLGLGGGEHITKEILPEYLTIFVTSSVGSSPCRLALDHSVGRYFLLHSQEATLLVRLDGIQLRCRSRRASNIKADDPVSSDSNRQPFTTCRFWQTARNLVRMQQSRPRLPDRPPTPSRAEVSHTHQTV